MPQKPWVPYAAPFAVFMLFTALAPLWPDGHPLLYIAKTLVVGALLWHWRKAYRPDAMSGKLNSGETVRDPLSKDRSSY